MATSVSPIEIDPSPAPRTTLKDYLDLARPFTLLAPFVGILCGALMAFGFARAAGATPSSEVMLKAVLLAIAGGLMNAGSNAINQIYDLDIDRVNKPTRPLPSGRLSMQTAWIFTWVFFLQAWMVAAWVGMGPLVVVAIASFLAVFYSAPPLRFKNNGVVANIAMAIPRGILLVVAGWLAVLPSPIFQKEPWLVGCVMFLFVVGAATTKDYADMEGDAQYGAKTLPVLLGVHKSAALIAPCFVLPYIVIAIFALTGLLPQTTLPIALLGFWGAYIVWLILRDPDALSKGENHPSWKHMYLLLTFSYVGFATAFLMLKAPG